MKDWQLTLLIGHAWLITSFFLPSGPGASIATGFGVGLIALCLIDRLRA